MLIVNDKTDSSTGNLKTIPSEKAIYATVFINAIKIEKLIGKSLNCHTYIVYLYHDYCRQNMNIVVARQRNDAVETLQDINIFGACKITDEILM